MSSDGYFQMQIWFWAAVEEKPCVETISCDVSDHVRLQTYVSGQQSRGVILRRTHLAAGVQLAEHVPKLHVPKAYVFILRSPASCEEARDVRVPRQRLDGCGVLVELPQRRVTRW